MALHVWGECTHGELQCTGVKTVMEIALCVQVKSHCSIKSWK